jgi:hypothetical protein
MAPFSLRLLSFKYIYKPLIKRFPVLSDKPDMELTDRVSTNTNISHAVKGLQDVVKLLSEQNTSGQLAWEVTLHKVVVNITSYRKSPLTSLRGLGPFLMQVP